MTATIAPAPRPAHRHAFAAGARAMVPFLFGITPFGVVIGVTAAHSGVPHLAAASTGWLIYGGSAQLAVIELLSAGAAPTVVIATMLAINARLLLYSAAMATRWRGTRRGWRVLAAYLLVDPSFAVGVAGYERQDTARAGHSHYLGGASVLWVTWQLAIGTGLTLGSVVPDGLSLDFVVPLYLVAMVVPKATTGQVRTAVVATASACVAGTVLPLHLGSILGIAAGVTAGLWYGRTSR